MKHAACQRPLFQIFILGWFLAGAGVWRGLVTRKKAATQKCRGQRQIIIWQDNHLPFDVG
jgi:hypothetical protein